MRLRFPVEAPRGFCEECGAILVAQPVQAVQIGPKFDRLTGKPGGLTRWQTWDCPNKQFVERRGWVHTAHTDYDIEAPAE